MGWLLDSGIWNTNADDAWLRLMDRQRSLQWKRSVGHRHKRRRVFRSWKHHKVARASWLSWISHARWRQRRTKAKCSYNPALHADPTR